MPKNPMPPRDFATVEELRAVVSRTRRTLADSLRLAGHALARVERLVIDVGRDGREIVTSAVALWRSVEAALREAEALSKATPRVARILREIGRIAAVYRMYHIRAAFLSEASAASALDALHHREAQRLRLLLESLGGGVLKVGQLLSCRADLLPAAWIAELRLLQDAVPPAPEAEVEALLAAERPALVPFASIEPTPLAAASLAQVHRAVLADGRAVAVKIQRPGVDQLIAQDRRALALVAEILGPLFEEIALGPVLAEIGRSLVAELDFEAEAAMAGRFAEALGPERVPTVIAATPRVIVMELVDGERLLPFLESAATAERDALLETLARTTAEAILVHGLVHSDPHPGNYLVRRADSGLVLLDFGAALTLTEDERRAIVALLPAMFGKNEARTRELLATLGFSAPDPEWPAKFALAVADTLVPRDLATIDPRAELERGLALARQYPGMVVPAWFVQVGRSLAGLGGLFLTWRPAVDLGQILFQTLARASAPR